MNKDIIKEKILSISKIGEDPEGGISRIFGSKYVEKCQKEILQYFKSYGMKVWIDTVGNVHGLYECGIPEAKEIIIGSHIDTVKQGGIFDGLLGVVAGAEIISQLKKDNVRLCKNIHIIGTNGEEGNELGGTFGSRAMMGLLDYNNKNYLEKAITYHYSKEDLKSAILNISQAQCYMELHIEQGPTLYNNKEQIGIVTGIVGLRRYEITVSGKSNHAGTTMMSDRDDALVAASKLVLMGDELAKQIGNHFVETVGIFNVYPGSPAIIPNKVKMVVEIRNENTDLMDYFIDEYSKRANSLANVQIEKIVAKSPVKCATNITKVFEKVCDKKDILYRYMPSGATHDGNAFALKMPIGMIFVPSKDGISHAKEEWTEWQDIFTGINVMYEAVKNLAEEKY